MLALSRKKDESIIVDGDIEIVVLDISGDQVKLGIKAPKHISIHRKEIYLQIQEENTKAVNTALTSEKLKELKNNLKK